MEGVGSFGFGCDYKTTSFWWKLGIVILIRDTFQAFRVTSISALLITSRFALNPLLYGFCFSDKAEHVTLRVIIIFFLISIYLI